SFLNPRIGQFPATGRGSVSTSFLFVSARFSSHRHSRGDPTGGGFPQADGGPSPRTDRGPPLRYRPVPSGRRPPPCPQPPPWPARPIRLGSRRKQCVPPPLAGRCCR